MIQLAADITVVSPPPNEFQFFLKITITTDGFAQKEAATPEGMTAVDSEESIY